MKDTATEKPKTPDPLRAMNERLNPKNLANMVKLKHTRSTGILNLLIAIVITLTVNFSYLLSMMVEQRENNDQRNKNEHAEFRKPEREGVLRLSRDGYGYMLSESAPSPEHPDSVRIDSVFVNNRKVKWYNLNEGDSLLCTIFPPRGGSNPILDEVLRQNGNEINAPMIFDRPKRDQDMAMQMLYYFALSYLLMTIMTARIHKQKFLTRSYMQRCAMAVEAAFACYFFAPVINWQTGKSVMIFNHGMYLDLIVMLKCTVVLAVAVLYGRIYALLYRQQQILLENEHLRNENLQTRYNMLMGQINPHFFFNSLNSLAMLVRDGDEQKALAYIDQLSYTFRYIIQNGQNTKSTLEEEMAFAHAYGELFKVRYADKLFFDTDIDPRYLKWTLPALSLQPLIGNAVKHNTITRKQPFHVSIRTEGGTLVVSNRKAPKLEPEPGMGIGLKNLRSRWQLITGEDIRIIETDDEFTVRLPLQKPIAE